MLVNIQALRALAALMVVYVHCEILLAPLSQVAPVFESYRDSLASGVDLFFVISGFIMVYTTMNNPSPSDVLCQAYQQNCTTILDSYIFCLLCCLGCSDGFFANEGTD